MYFGGNYKFKTLSTLSCSKFCKDAETALKSTYHVGTPEVVLAHYGA
jgi:hypothetical protein